MQVIRDFVTFGLDAEREEDWVAVLKIAHLWDCQVIKALAISHLHTILSTLSEDTSFRRLELARIYGVDVWVGMALDGLAMRRATLTVEEIAGIQPADLRCIIEAREAKLRESMASRSEVHVESDTLSLLSPQDEQ